MAYYFSGQVVSSIAQICELVDCLIHQLRPYLSKDELMELKLILSELMINSCEHGNCNDREKFVSLDLKVTEDYIDLIVKDEGRGFIYDQEPYDVFALSCGGRGLKIVSALCDSFVVKDSEVHCVIQLGL